MAVDIPYNEPLQVRAGLNWYWKRKLDDFPAPTWTLRYWLKKADAHIEIAATASGSEHSVSRLASATGNDSPGTYAWYATVEDGAGNKYPVDNGTMKVLPRIDNSSALDARTSTQKIVDALQAAYESYVEDRPGVASYAIADRTMTFSSAKELAMELDTWKARLVAEREAERRRNGLSVGNKLLVRPSA